jgi:hypothetical protein
MSAMDPRSTLGMLEAIEKLMEDQGRGGLVWDVVDIFWTNPMVINGISCNLLWI